MAIKMPVLSSAKTDLFAAYARFEFALKEAGFLDGKDGEKATPNWRCFSAQESLSDIYAALSGDADVSALIADPPRQQIVDGKTLAWKEGAPISSTKDLLMAVKAVRDNLFHGGKSGEDPRDDMLCRAAIKILTACLERHSDVKAMFNGEY